MSDPVLGSKVVETIIGRCPRCETEEALKPGPLNEARTVEYRRCEECDQVVESKPYFYCLTKDATRAVGR